MTYQQACRLSEVGIAVRCRGDLVQYWTWDPDAQKTPSPKAPARDVQPRAARLVDHRYAPIYQDWLPWMPRDVITMLGDLVRLQPLVELVA